MDLLKRAGMRPLENYVRYYRLRWAGHVRRMDESRLPKRVLFGEIAGSRERGRPNMNWIDSLKDDCIKVNIPADKYLTQSTDLKLNFA